MIGAHVLRRVWPLSKRKEEAGFLGLIDNYALQVTAAASCSAARKYRLLRS